MIAKEDEGRGLETRTLFQCCYQEFQERSPWVCETLWLSTNFAFLVAMVAGVQKLGAGYGDVAVLYLFIGLVPFLLLYFMIRDIGQKEMNKAVERGVILGSRRG